MFADARPTVASRRQRMCAVEKKKCAQRSVVNADGVAVYDRPTRPVHVVAGTAGATMYFNAEYDKEFTEKIDFVHGFGRATAHNATHLTFLADINDHPLVFISSASTPRACRK